MLKVAVFSDVHANLPALKAVLADIKKQGIDQVYCLGDLVDLAPWPNEVIDLIREEQIPVIMGNHDERIAFDMEVLRLSKHSEEEAAARVEGINWTRKTITSENKEYLGSLPKHLKLSFALNDSLFNMLMVHGSPRSLSEYIYEDHDEEDALQMMESNDAHLMIMGHTHLPYFRVLKNNNTGIQRTMINCGSVGRSKEIGRLATYLILHFTYSSSGYGNYEIEHEIKRLSYNIDETIDAIEKSDIPNFYAEFLRGVVS